ncbi:MAG: 50S ribosomal protein L22 [Flavobacteriales bacterium]|jgi:large subunit ribosomal protein L22|tara:strand:- start:1355 stop:1750 length:396 start_codon:yes stop_codon:yes gene_type:complete
MGARKGKIAEERKEARKTQYIARLNNCPSSPRKMRLVADLVRGIDVVKASNILQFHKQAASNKLEKLIWSAVANFEEKSGENWENSGLFVKEIQVDGARMLKRIKPRAQGRANRIRKRSNHVTLVLGTQEQ